MKRLLIEKLPLPGQPSELSEAEAKHAIQVFRLRNGDRIELIDGKGHALQAILRTQGKRVWTESSGEQSSPSFQSHPALLSLPITVELAVLKGDAMEWAIEKSVELGVRTLVPVLSKHCVVQMDRKGPEIFLERWQKIADQSLKQCGRLEKMEILLPLSLEMRLSQVPSTPTHPRLYADEAAKGDAEQFLAEWLEKNVAREMEELTLLIGPEGGWSELERPALEHSSHGQISLGPWVLRAETACLYAASLANAHFRRRNLDKSAWEKGI